MKAFDYKNYPFIETNERFLQMSFSFCRIMNVYQKKSSLEKDINGFKRRENFEAENF